LTEYMEAASEPKGPRPEIFDAERDKAIFKRTFSILRRAAESDEATIGRKIFGAVDTKRQIRGQFAVYHYEGLALGIQPIIDRLNENDTEQMSRLGRLIFEIKIDPTLRNHTGGGKNTAPAFRDRIRFFGDRLSAV
jgi:hypothetical protein